MFDEPATVTNRKPLVSDQSLNHRESVRVRQVESDRLKTPDGEVGQPSGTTRPETKGESATPPSELAFRSLESAGVVTDPRRTTENAPNDTCSLTKTETRLPLRR
jgi:hypothetical protein